MLHTRHWYQQFDRQKSGVDFDVCCTRTGHTTSLDEFVDIDGFEKVEITERPPG